MATPRG